MANEVLKRFVQWMDEENAANRRHPYKGAYTRSSLSDGVEFFRILSQAPQVTIQANRVLKTGEDPHYFLVAMNGGKAVSDTTDLRVEVNEESLKPTTARRGENTTQYVMSLSLATEDNPTVVLRVNSALGDAQIDLTRIPNLRLNNSHNILGNLRPHHVAKLAYYIARRTVLNTFGYGRVEGRI